MQSSWSKYSAMNVIAPCVEDIQPFGPVGIEEAHRVPRSRIKSPQSFLASFTVWSFSIGELYCNWHLNSAGKKSGPR